MGRILTPATPPPDGGEPPPSDGSVVGWLKAIYDLLAGWLKPGRSFAHIDPIYITLGANIQQLYPNTNKLVKWAIIQNVSQNPMTLFTYPGGTLTAGIVLNPAPGVGQAGGSITVGDVDLNQFYVYSASTNDIVTVYYET